VASDSFENRKRARDENVRRNYNLQRKAGLSHSDADKRAREQADRTCERLDRQPDGWIGRAK
jgi:hypothetical protein